MSGVQLVDLLRDHIGHRTTLVEPARGLAVKCIDCSGRLIDLSHALGLRPSSSKPTSTSTLPLGLHDPTACPHHTGEPATTCGRCRSDHLAGDAQPPPISQVRTGSDPTAVPEWQAARELAAQLAQRNRQARAAEDLAHAARMSPPTPTVEAPDEPEQEQP